MKWTLLLVLAAAAPAVQAEPWLCTQPDGNKAFSYEPESAKNRNCVDHPIASGNVVRLRPRNADDSAQRAAQFPRVDSKTQKQRDLARRQILERELAEEKKSLAAAVKQLSEQQRAVANAREAAAAEEKLRPLRDKVRLHISNIGNIEKELGREG